MLVLSCLVFFFSCVSTPDAKTDTPVGATPAATASGTVSAADAQENATDAAAQPAPAENALPAPTKPEEEDAVPSVPPAEKMLYFYPEPEATLIIPEKKPAEPQVAKKEQAVKSAPAAKPEVAPKKEPPAPKKDVPVEKKESKESSAGNATSSVLPGIWENEPVAPSITPVTPEKIAPPAPPSRQVSIPAGQTLEVWYPGSGWVFLGDASAQNGLGYENRKLDKKDTLFTFKALKPGNYILDFSRYDVLEDNYTQDSIGVTVFESLPPRTGKVRAPDYHPAGTVAAGTGAAQTGIVPAGTVAAGTGSSVAPGSAGSSPAGVTAPGVPNAPVNPASAAQTRSVGGTQTGNGVAPYGNTVPLSSASTPAMINEPTLQAVPAQAGMAALNGNAAVDPADLLKKAQASLASGDAAGALATLDQFFASSVTSLDEGWYLRGQAYEVNGPARDMRKALEAYETLDAAYPESARWKDADGRIRYIKQFYLKIR